MPCAVLVVKGLFMTVGGKSNLQGKVNNHTPTVRLISLLSMKRNVWIPVKRSFSISGIMCFLSCVAIATWNLATLNFSAHEAVDIEQQMTKCVWNHTKVIVCLMQDEINWEHDDENEYEHVCNNHRMCLAEKSIIRIKQGFFCFLDKVLATLYKLIQKIVFQRSVINTCTHDLITIALIIWGGKKKFDPLKKTLWAEFH